MSVLTKPTGAWICTWLKNGTQTMLCATQDEALAEEHRIRFEGCPHVISWFCSNWEAAA